MMHLGRTLPAAVIGVILLTGARAHLAALQDPSKADPEGIEFFEKKVRPVLAGACYTCHSSTAKVVEGGLKLDSRDDFLKGGESGPVVVPGEPDKSRLVRAIRYADEELQMPPKKRLPDEHIANIEAWIKRGAPYPVTKTVDRSKSHWAFLPPKNPAPPEVSHKAWVKTPIDAFIVAELEKKGLEPSPLADKRTLLRRATYDLSGLPPTPEEIDAFLADDSPNAFEKVVDRLLASPRYGERWGRYWLDVARYSDTKGYLFEEERRYAYAYTYRDWVIGAFNDDLPYDQFLIQQIAADRLPLGEDKRPLAAMGFLTVGRRFLNNPPDIIDDRIDVVARGTMGLTIGCARCHDHKFDPIPSKDYYSLYGVFASSPESVNTPVIPSAAKPEETKAFEEELKKREAAVEQYKKERHAAIVASLKKPAQVLAYHTLATQLVAKPADVTAAAHDHKLLPHVLQRWINHLKKAPWWNRSWPDSTPAQVPVAEVEALLNPDEQRHLRDLRLKIEDLKITHPGAPAHPMSLEDAPKPHNPRVFVRGNPGNLGPEVPRKFPEVLGGRIFTEGSGRLELARAIASPENPLTARVWVNRVWLHHFGAAIVRTPSDFGMRSEPPTHAELLDWLARRLVAEGWSTKKLHRLILLSNSWQQASGDNPKAREIDPENRLVWRMNRLRLDFEAMRDSLLFVAGELDLTMGGHAVDLGSRRRAVYLMIERQNLPGLFRTFDFAGPDTHSPQRFSTTVPQQALFLMNSPFVIGRVRHLANRADAKETDARLQQLYRMVFGRTADDGELALGRKFIETEMARPPNPVATKARDWRYGLGSYDPEKKLVKKFTPLPHFTGDTWQGGPGLPDPQIGWVLLDARGGHPGKDMNHVAIRRWIAPRDGTISVRGTLKHPDTNGDGVQGHLISSRLGELASWVVHHREAKTEMTAIDVKKGDTIDFLVDCRANESYDSFEWAPIVRLGEDEWNATANFSGPLPEPLSPWERYAQVLLMTNEFDYVD